MKNFLIALLFLFAIKTYAQQIEAVKNPNLPYQYWVHYPQGYKENPNKKYPLLLSLHGRSLSGTDLERVKNYGVIYEILRGLKIDFIVVAPQCQNGWDNAKLIQVLDHAEKSYRVDKSRVYLTGMSMGGYGAWYLAGQHPTRFAAVAPVCGGGKTSDAQNLKSLPHWVHHGVKDIPVPFAESEKMVNAIRAAGNKNVEFSVYKDWGHSELVVVFSKKELYDWFMKYTRNVPAEAKEPEIVTKAELKPQTHNVKVEHKSPTSLDLKPKLTKEQPQNNLQPTKPSPQQPSAPTENKKAEYVVFDESKREELDEEEVDKDKKDQPNRPTLVQRKQEPEKTKPKLKEKLNEQFNKVKNWELWEKLK